MIKWYTLQLNQMPIIAIQTDEAIKKLQQQLKIVNQFGNPQDIDQLNEMRKSFERRISALDRFYEQKYQYDSIEIFHMLKLKLQKAIFDLKHIHYDTLSSDMVTNMFEDSKIMKRSIEKKKSQPFSQKSSKMENQFETFNNSRDSDLMRSPYKDNSNSFEKEFHDEPLFKNKKSSKIISPSSSFHSKSRNKQQNRQIATKNGNNEGKNRIKTQKSQKNERIQNKKVEVNYQQKQKANKNGSSKTIISNERNKAERSKNLAMMQKKLQKDKKFPSKKNIIKTKNEHIGKQKEKKIDKQRQKQKQKEINRRQDEELVAIDENQFRFTIKMTKQEYQKLQKMKEQMINIK